MLDYEKAADDYSRAIALSPYMAVAFNGWGVALEKLGRDEDARVNFARASQLDKQYASPRYNSGLLLARNGLIDQARVHLEEALVLSPRDCEILCALGDVSTMAGDYTRALRYFERGLDEPLGHQHLAWLLATCPGEGIRDGSRAIAHAKIACDQTGWKDPGCLETLAAAYGESGNFEEAIALQTRAVRSSAPERVTSAEARLRMLERREPIRDWRGK